MTAEEKAAKKLECIDEWLMDYEAYTPRHAFEKGWKGRQFEIDEIKNHLNALSGDCMAMSNWEIRKTIESIMEML